MKNDFPVTAVPDDTTAFVKYSEMYRVCVIAYTERLFMVIRRAPTRQSLRDDRFFIT